MPATDELLRQELTRRIKHLNGDCLRVLLSQAQALHKGHREYGDLDLENYPKDAIHEALEEARDMANYLTFRLLQLERIDGYE